MSYISISFDHFLKAFSSASFMASSLILASRAGSGLYCTTACFAASFFAAGFFFGASLDRELGRSGLLKLYLVSVATGSFSDAFGSSTGSCGGA